MRAQIINHMNSSLDSYLVNGQMTKNKVRIKGIEILSAASLLSTVDIFVFTSNFGIHTRAIRKPRSSNSNTCQSF